MTDGDERRSPVDDGDESRSPTEWLRWFWNVDHGPVMYVREVLVSAGSVLLVGLLLFAVSGIWPPMVAVESGSMDPNMQKGDLVFVMEEERLAPGYAEEGVVTYRTGDREGYRKFNAPGDVVVYRPDGRAGVTPIIHRARFRVNESENWYDKANPAHMNARNCADLANCPAPHAGFVTKGDNNAQYDQATSLGACGGTCDIVKPAWVVGTAHVRVPYLGYVKLTATGGAEPTVTASTNESAGPSSLDVRARGTAVGA